MIRLRLSSQVPLQGPSPASAARTHGESLGGGGTGYSGLRRRLSRRTHRRDKRVGCSVQGRGWHRRRVRMRQRRGDSELVSEHAAPSTVASAWCPSLRVLDLSHASASRPSKDARLPPPGGPHVYPAVLALTSREDALPHRSVRPFGSRLKEGSGRCDADREKMRASPS